MTDVAEITLDDVQSWTMREAAHYNGGKEWFGYGHICNQNPRLYRIDKYMKKDRSVISTWSVDGSDCIGIEQAIERLNQPPVLSADELAMLAAVVPGHIRETRNTEAYAALPGAVSLLHYWLPRKGMIEARNGFVTLTALGASHLRKEGGAS